MDLKLQVVLLWVLDIWRNGQHPKTLGEILNVTLGCGDMPTWCKTQIKYKFMMQFTLLAPIKSGESGLTAGHPFSTLKCLLFLLPWSMLILQDISSGYQWFSLSFLTALNSLPHMYFLPHTCNVFLSETRHRYDRIIQGFRVYFLWNPSDIGFKIHHTTDELPKIYASKVGVD